jgi:hypothetical protein
MPKGGDCADHVLPPLVVPMTVEPSPGTPLSPTAMHVTERDVVQEMLKRSTALLGAVCVIHVLPISDEVIT